MSLIGLGIAVVASHVITPDGAPWWQMPATALGLCVVIGILFAAIAVAREPD